LSRINSGRVSSGRLEEGNEPLGELGRWGVVGGNINLCPQEVNGERTCPIYGASGFFRIGAKTFFLREQTDFGWGRVSFRRPEINTRKVSLPGAAVIVEWSS